jgi:hypothetical protein
VCDLASQVEGSAVWRSQLKAAGSAPGAPGENRLLPQTTAELDRLGLVPREVAHDGGLCPGRPLKPWLGSHLPGSSSPLGPSRAPSAPAGAWPATAPAARAASATSNAATTCAAAACEATRASGPGPAGRSWATPRHPGCLTGPHRTAPASAIAPAIPPSHTHPSLRGK